MKVKVAGIEHFTCKLLAESNKSKGDCEFIWCCNPIPRENLIRLTDSVPFHVANEAHWNLITLFNNNGKGNAQCQGHSK